MTGAPVPPDSKKRRPRQEDGVSGNRQVGTRTDALSVANGDAAAWRCWTWRWCGCTQVADCRVLGPLPLRAESCCPGEFGPDGAFRAHCLSGVAS